jgi:asparagine synthase (glutamine-hydrolysing)
MCDRMQHRGPDGYGLWLDAQPGVAFGHRRLAIIDLSPTGFQPMSSVDQRYVITYNGELYYRHEIASELDLTFRGTSDTEVLVEAISRFGIDGALERANGLFAFSAYDRASGTLHFGTRPSGDKAVVLELSA